MSELMESRATNGDPALLNDVQRENRLNSALLHAIVGTWKRRRLVLGLTTAAAVAAVVISLLIPKYYEASSRVLLPDGGGIGAGLTHALGDLSPIAARLMGGGGGSGNYNRYIAILTSNSVRDAVIEEFDLTSVYRLEDSAWPRSATRGRLARNTSFDVDLKYNHLTVRVLDQDPERAAAMANFIVGELNRRNSLLATQNASNYRQYVEQRYHQIVAGLDSAQTHMQRFQETHGVLELPSMAESFYRGLAEQRGTSLRGEIQYMALLQQYGPDNPRVIAAGEAVRAARRAEGAAMSGQEALLPVAMRDMPALANEYARIYRNVLLQAELLKVAQPMYEQAKFEEERERVAVQVLDVAELPERRVKPHRSMIVATATVSVFMLSLLLALGLTWIERAAPGLRTWFAAAGARARES